MRDDMQSTQDAIEVQDLSFSYPVHEGETAIPVFEDLNLQIDAGSFVAILGHNRLWKIHIGQAF